MRGKRLMFTSTPRIDQMIQTLMDVDGYLTTGEVLRNGVMELYRRNHPTWKADPNDPKRERRQSKKEKQKMICAELGGTVSGEGQGMVCTFTKFETLNPKHVESFETTVPLHDLSEETVKSQYLPDKETVQKILKHKK